MQKKGEKQCLRGKPKYWNDLFLVVLYVCDKDVKKMPKAEPLRRDGMVGAKIASKGRVWEVLFPVEDRRGGKIRITDGAGRTLFDGNLAEVVKSDE